MVRLLYKIKVEVEVDAQNPEELAELLETFENYGTYEIESVEVKKEWHA